jgi:hypothetical protein
MRHRALWSFAVVSLASLAAPVLVLAADCTRAAPSGATSAPVHPLRVLVTPAPPEAQRVSCDACVNWNQCEAGLHRANASVQLVALKNGVMRIYTADTPAHARVVQALLARRDEYLHSLDEAGETARLCPGCRTVRGAALSGKLVRQVVPVDGGCITITTSSDPGVVALIRMLSTPTTAALARPRN